MIAHYRLHETTRAYALVLRFGSSGDIKAAIGQLTVGRRTRKIAIRRPDYTSSATGG